jgi:hypothetical protein
VFLPMGSIKPENQETLSAAMRRVARRAESIGTVRVFYQ